MTLQANKSFVRSCATCYRDDAFDLLAPDTTPDPFSFTPQTGVALSTVATSNTITVTGISAAAPISVVGGDYSINGGAYTAAAGSVNNGNTVTVRQTSSGSYGTLTTATLTIGGVTGNFNVTTMAAAVLTMTANAGTTPQSATVSTAFANALAVTVKDAGNNPVSGVGVRSRCRRRAPAARSRARY